MPERTAGRGVAPNGRVEALGEAPNEVEGLGVGRDPLRGTPVGVQDGGVVAPGEARADGWQRLAGVLAREVHGDLARPREAGGAARKLIEIESRFLKENDTVRLIVTDTGHGISPRDRDKLFLPKFSTRDRGTGLGLAIVSHIVADHKGRIWVEDNQPRGARFIIELPAGRPE